MVVAPSRDEQQVAGGPSPRHIARFGDDLEAEDVDVEGADAVEVGGPQMDVADAHTGIDRFGHRSRLDVSTPPGGIWYRGGGAVPPPRILLPSVPKGSAPTMSTVYAVEGMTCEHCVRSVTEEVGEVSGVRAVEVDLASGRLVVHGEGVDAAAVRAAVDEAGYAVAS
jgi:copper chaperone CopZ